MSASVQSAQEPRFNLNLERVICDESSATPAKSKCIELASSETPVFDLETVILNHVRHVLELNHGNKLRTARQLGVSRSTLYRILGNDRPS